MNEAFEAERGKKGDERGRDGTFFFLHIVDSAKSHCTLLSASLKREHVCLCVSEEYSPSLVLPHVNRDIQKFMQAYHKRCPSFGVQSRSPAEAVLTHTHTHTYASANTHTSALHAGNNNIFTQWS